MSEDRLRAAIERLEADQGIQRALLDPAATPARDRYPLEGYIALFAEDHQHDLRRGGCTCGFCAWSPEHVAIMAYREACDRTRAALAGNRTGTEGD